MKIGKEVDSIIEGNFSDGRYVYRAIGKEDHPKLSLDALVVMIVETGTDKYDAKRKEICAKEFSSYDHDIQAGFFEIKDGKIILDNSYEYPTLFGDTVKKFYENVFLDRGHRIRIDLLLVYDANKLVRAKKVDSKMENVRPELEECLYKFEDSNNKQGALIGIVKILRQWLMIRIITHTCLSEKSIKYQLL